LPLLPVVLIIGCIGCYGVNVPFADDWDFTPLVTKAAHHKLQIKELFKQHNEHRMFVPKLLIASNVWVSRWDLRVQMLLSVILCGVTTYSIALLAKRTLPVSKRTQAGLIFGISVLLFSPIQYENWLWGFQFAFFIPPLCLAVSWVILISNLRLGAKFALSALLAAIGTFSFPTGGFAWLLTFPLFLLTAIPVPGKKVIQWIGYWLATAAGCFALYLVDYHEPVHTARILSGFHFWPYVEYAMVFVGGNMFRGIARANTTLPFVLGLFLTSMYLLVLGYLLKARNAQELKVRSLPWAAFGAFALASASLCAFGRRPYFTAQQALESRYTSFSLLLIVALVGLLALSYHTLRPTLSKWAVRTWPWMAGAGIGILAAGYLASTFFSFEQMGYLRTYRLDGKAALQYSRILRDPGVAEAIMTATLYPDIRIIRKSTEMLDAANVVRPPVAKEPRMHDDIQSSRGEKKGPGRFDSIAAADDQYVASGWAILPEGQERADGIVLAFLHSDGSWVPLTMAAEREDRPDSENLVGGRSLKNIGWRARFPAALLPPEARELSAWAIDARTGKSYKLEGTPQVP
jgi:hypothetical protein